MDRQGQICIGRQVKARLSVAGIVEAGMAGCDPDRRSNAGKARLDAAWSGEAGQAARGEERPVKEGYGRQG